MFLGQTSFGLDELLHCVAISEGIWCEYQTIVQLHHQFFLFLFLFSSSYTIQRVSIELESNSNHHLLDHKEITKSDVNTRLSLNYNIVSPFLFLFVQFRFTANLQILESNSNLHLSNHTRQANLLSVNLFLVAWTFFKSVWIWVYNNKFPSLPHLSVFSCCIVECSNALPTQLVWKKNTKCFPGRQTKEELPTQAEWQARCSG